MGTKDARAEQESNVARLAFGVWRLAFGVWRSAFGDRPRRRLVLDWAFSLRAFELRIDWMLADLPILVEHRWS